MDKKLSYTNVNDKGYAAFGAELEKGIWLEIRPHERSKPMTQEEITIVLKYWLWRGVRKVLIAMGLSSLTQEADREWERCQTRLSNKIAFDKDDKDPAVRAAASRCEVSLLSGNGTAQNSLPLQLEVDYGNAQHLQCREDGPRFLDIQLLGYQSLMTEIDRATKELASALGRDLEISPAARAEEIREAVQYAVKVFSLVSANIEMLLTDTEEGSDAHVLLKKCQSSLQHMLERYAVGKTPMVGSEPTTVGASTPVAPVTPVAPAAPATPNPGGNPFID